MSTQQTILLVEDEKTLREVLASQFKAAGFTVLEAGDGEQGLNTALSARPDIILLDNNMPMMTGFSMLKRLREYDSWGEHVPVIFFSNIEPTGRDEREDLESIAPTAYLIKGDTDLSQIVAKIKEVLASGK